MVRIVMKELLECGVHFGHQTRRWNPKMKPYIYSTRKNIHILDLQKTVNMTRKAMDYITSRVAEGAQLLYVGTKKQAKKAVVEQATRCGMPYVNNRWLGGMLTNFETVRKSLDLLKEIEAMEASGALARRPVKERIRLEKRKGKLTQNLGGIRDLKGIPGLIFVVDTRKDAIAVAEARRLKIPVVALVDTNCNPDEVDHPIPANDDAIRAINLFCTLTAEAVLEGKAELEKRKAEADALVEKEDANAMLAAKQSEPAVEVAAPAAS